MTKVFVLLAIALILSGGLVLFGPQVEQVAATRSLAPSAEAPGAGAQDGSPAMANYVQIAREFAEKANAPLSILFGLISLFYSRRTYNINRARIEAERARSA